MQSGKPTLQSLFRYPVKGLSPEPLARVQLMAGDFFPGDRMFAVENGPSGFDPTAPAHQPKIKFLMLMRNERLATLRTRYHDASGALVIARDRQEVVRANLATAQGRADVEIFFRTFMPEELRGDPKVIASPPGFRFTDSRRGHVSIINLASVAALETIIGMPVDPLRFRGNLYVNGWPAWSEFNLVGREITVGSARLKVTKRIERCAATDVDPVTGMRDLFIPRTLMQAYGHTDCGVYAEVKVGGEIAAGNRIDIREPQEILPF